MWPIVGRLAVANAVIEDGENYGPRGWKSYLVGGAANKVGSYAGQILGGGRPSAPPTSTPSGTVQTAFVNMELQI